MKNLRHVGFIVIVFLASAVMLLPTSFSLTSGNSPDWIDISEAIEGGPATTLCVQPKELNTLYVGLNDKGIYKTSNHGETWELFNEGLDTENSKKINVLKIDPVDQNIMYLGTRAGLSSEGSNWVVGDALFKSVDGGKTWAVSNKGIIPSKKYFATAPSVHGIAIDPKTHSNIYIATKEGIYKSTDGGKNWMWSSTDIEVSSVSSVVIDPSRPKILYASGTGIYKSEDSGKTWDLLGLEDESIRSIVLDPQNTDIIYAGGRGVLKTTNGGKTWIDTGLTSKYDRIPFVHDIEIVEGNPSTLYVATNLGIYKSNNEGESWVELTPSKLILFWSSNDIALLQNGIIYSAANGFKDKPGGLVWMWQEEQAFTTYLSAPANLLATTSTSSIALNWSASIQSAYPIQGYSIYKGISSGGENAIPIAAVDASTTMYTDVDVAFGETYYYFVKAFDNQNPPNYSSPSNEVSAALEDTTSPTLIIISPSNYSKVGTNFVLVKGTAIDNESGISRVTVNGSEVSVASNGSFSKTVTLTEGINTITIIATDIAGNTATKAITVTYQKAVQTTTITLWPDNPMMLVSGVSQEIDPGRSTKPVIIPEWSRTVVPIRAIVEALGGTIGWENTTRKVTINFKGTVIKLWIDNPKAKVNGTEVWIDPDNHNVRPIIVNDRTMLPLRFVAESLGCIVDWDSDTRTITITYRG